MAEYDFKRLTDKEFEFLCTDIISEVENCRVERFKAGKDQGVDGQFYSDDSREIIIQCKHWMKTGITSLLNHLERKERDKVLKLEPKRYIFMTSLELSRANKRKIKNIFTPYIRKQNDIYGYEDLCSLIEKYQDLEKRHYKLWLISSNILHYYINNDIFSRSEFKLKEIIEFSKKYICTDKHKEALKKLDALHTLIVTGAAGIGKTTLADQLTLNYIKDGYELVLIEHSIEEADRLFSNTKKQIFYFDDFLGRNFNQALKKHEDSHIMTFIRKVSSDCSKRFILTSRSTILEKEKTAHDLFMINNIERNEFELEIDDLKTFDKARILYNHIWFSDVDEEYFNQLYKNKNYMTIIRHRNYNPRLINFITDWNKVASLKKDDYWEYVCNTLDNPKVLWRNIYNNQIGLFPRIILNLVVFNGSPIEEELLKNYYYSYIGEFIHQDKVDINNDFFEISKICTGSVLNRVVYSDKIMYSLYNPSIADYVLEKFRGNKDILQYFKSLKSLKSLNNFLNLFKDSYFSQEEKEIIEGLFLYIFENTIKYDEKYILYAINERLKFEEFYSLDKMIMKYLTEIGIDDIYNRLSVIDFCEILIFMIENGYKNDDVCFDILENIIRFSEDLDDFSSVLKCTRKVISVSSYCLSEYLVKIKQCILEYLNENVVLEVVDNNIIIDILDHKDCDIAFQKIYDYLTSILEEFDLDFNDEDIDQILQHFDLHSIIEDNIDCRIADYSPNSLYEYEQSDILIDQQIHELFERE